MAQSRTTLGLLTALIILGALGYLGYQRMRPEPDETEEVREMSDAEAEVVQSVTQQFATDIPTPVRGALAVRDTLRLYVGAKARAEAFREAKLTAQVSGIVQSVRVRENQQVGSGELLIRIDTTEYALDLAASRASLGRATVDYQVRLLDDEMLEDSVLRADRAEIARYTTGLAQAEVDLQRAQLNMQKTRITAPFGGRIADLRVVEGQYVGAGTELLTVVTLDPIKVSVSVLEAHVVQLEEGSQAHLDFLAMPDTVFVGRVETINPIVDLETNTTRVTVVLPNPDARIRPGMYADALVEAQKIPDVIQVPRTAIRETDDRRTHLFVYKDGRADWVYVPLGRQNDTMVELLGEPGTQFWVEPGSIVLVEGHQSIIHDGAVELVEDVAAAGGRPTR